MDFFWFQFHALQIKGFSHISNWTKSGNSFKGKKITRDFKKLCFPVEKSSLFWQDFLIMNTEKNLKESERCRDLVHIELNKPSCCLMVKVIVSIFVLFHACKYVSIYVNNSIVLHF